MSASPPSVTYAAVLLGQHSIPLPGFCDGTTTGSPRERVPPERGRPATIRIAFGDRQPRSPIHASRALGNYASTVADLTRLPSRRPLALADFSGSNQARVPLQTREPDRPDLVVRLTAGASMSNVRDADADADAGGAAPSAGPSAPRTPAACTERATDRPQPASRPSIPVRRDPVCRAPREAVRRRRGYGRGGPGANRSSVCRHQFAGVCPRAALDAGRVGAQLRPMRETYRLSRIQLHSPSVNCLEVSAKSPRLLVARFQRAGTNITFSSATPEMNVRAPKDWRRRGL